MVSVTYLAAPPGSPVEPPRVAYTVGRPVGGAVHRNRVRRRLRSAMTELVASAPPPPAGAYLIRVGPQVGSCPYPDLCRHLAGALDVATSRSGRQ